MTGETEELRETVLAALLRNDRFEGRLLRSIVRGGLADESDVEILVEFASRKCLMDLSGQKNYRAWGGGYRRHNRLWYQA